MRKHFAVALCLMLTAVAAPAEAQWSWGVYGNGEFDTNDVVFVLGGLSLTRAGTGWTPVGGVQAYWLQYPSGDDDQSLFAVTPNAGLQNNFGSGAFGVRGGYQFQSEETDGAPAAVSTDVGEGAVIMSNLDWWGNGGPLAVQLLGSYNFGSESFWGRARGTTALLAMDPGSLRLGGEVAHLNAGGAGDFTSTAVGPVLEWHTGGGITMGFAGGRKFQDGDDATYFRFEMALFPSR